MIWRRAARLWAADGGKKCMEDFRILGHTADIGFEAFGQTRQEVFANAGRALQNLMVDLHLIVPREKIEIEVQGADAESLLVNWLSDILYRIDAEGRLFHDFEIRSITDRSLVAVSHGEPFDRARHQVNLQVKAITYHQLALAETPDGWRAQVYVDI
jgi:protein archease